MRYELSLIIRVLLALALLTPLFVFNFNIFQYLFEEILIKTTFYILKFINAAPVMGAYSVGDAIEILGIASIKIVGQCVTASAYYSLALLILLTKDIPFLKRMAIFLIGVFLIFIMNQVRILMLLFSALESSKDIFSELHLFFWITLSIVYVILLWLLFIRIFNIKSAPVYSDIKYLIKEIK